MAMTLSEIKTEYEKVYIMNDPHALKMLYAHYISFFINSDPVWLIMTGPSGGLKSELINSLNKCRFVHNISTITANTLVSGAKLGGGKSASYIQRLSEKEPGYEGSGIITFKDFTSILSMRDENRTEIMGQLRELYDGKYDKEFGTGHSVNWVGKITILAGSTHQIHEMRQKYASMGERFLFYDLVQPDRIDAGMQSSINSESGEILAKREYLAGLTQEYLHYFIHIADDLPPISEELRRKLVNIAEMATRARSSVNRDWRSPQREIISVNPPEMPTRFVAAIITMARSLMLINKRENGSLELTEEDEKILYKITLDSITISRRKIMQELSKYNVIETKGLAIKLGMPSSSLRRDAEDLVALEIAEREKGSGPSGDRWKIKDHYKKLIQQFEGIADTGADLTENNAESEEQLLAEAEQIRSEIEEAEEKEDKLF